MFRARVTDGRKEGGFLVVYDCPDVVLEMLAEQATRYMGFKVIISSLRCSIDSTVLRSFDYEGTLHPNMQTGRKPWCAPLPARSTRRGLTQVDKLARK